MVLELRKSVHGIKRYDKKNKKNWSFLVNPTFYYGQKSLSWSNLVKTRLIGPFFSWIQKKNGGSGQIRKKTLNRLVL
jgi:hypothetical protein